MKQNKSTVCEILVDLQLSELKIIIELIYFTECVSLTEQSTY